ncbi:MAG: NAD(P)/FAD-dependent oxidoreductase [Gemmatimonadaceae bacterium]
MTQVTDQIKDITIIGGGPTGLFAAFYAGMRGATAQIVDALPELGGQLAALYPEKYIFDVAGFPKVLAKDLVHALRDQAAQFRAPAHLGERVTALQEDGGHFVLVTDAARYHTRAIVIAAGIGAFAPRRLPQPFAAQWYGRGVYDVVLNPDEFRGQKVVIIGGGDTAFDWAHQLLARASTVTLVHRSDRFRAHAATIAEISAAAAAGRASLLTFHELAAIQGDAENPGGRVNQVTLKDVRTKTMSTVPCDVVLPMLGYVSDLGAIRSWGLTLTNNEVVVSSTMETGRRGVWAAGDITTYPGKLKLIATGFAEAAIAVNQAVHWIYPDRKIAPGHSSNMAVFGQQEDGS